MQQRLISNDIVLNIYVSFFFEKLIEGKKKNYQVKYDVKTYPERVNFFYIVLKLE